MKNVLIIGLGRFGRYAAKKLNEMGRSLADKQLIEYKPIKEVNGHTPMEVMLGCVLGFFVGLAFALLK